MSQLRYSLFAGLFGWSLLMTAALADGPQNIDIKITTHLGDHQSFVDGDRISFFLSLGQDAYVYLFYRDASSNLLQILPNQRLADHLFRKGMFLSVPSAQQPFQFTVQAPFGDERLFAFATDNGDLHFRGKQLDSGLTLIDVSIDKIEDDIRLGSAAVFGRSELRLKTLPAESTK